jgi:glyoxylase I family protein
MPVMTTCGCPQTEALAKTGGAIHHVIVNVKDVERAREFYGWLLPRVGYQRGPKHPRGGGWFSDVGSFWIKAAAPEFAADAFHKDRVGLCEIAFAAVSRAQVDALARDLVARGATVLDPPRDYDYTPGYYAVFFADPDGLKLELAHIPA